MATAPAAPCWRRRGGSPRRRGTRSVGASVERVGLVAVEIVGDVELADRRGPVGMRRSRRRVGVGKVVAVLRIDGAVLHRALGLVRDVVDRVVGLAEAVHEGARRRGVEAPGRSGVVAPGRRR
jgi:hypothetical protein